MDKDRYLDDYYQSVDLAMDQLLIVFEFARTFMLENSEKFEGDQATLFTIVNIILRILEGPR